MKHLVSLPEVFKKIATSTGTIDEKAVLLKSYDGKDVRFFVDFMYNCKEFDFDIPEYKKSTVGFGGNYMTLSNALPKIQAALNNRPVFSRNLRLVLENVSTEEADLLIHILQGKKIEGISKAVFKRAYPQFFRTVEGEAV